MRLSDIPYSFRSCMTDGTINEQVQLREEGSTHGTTVLRENRLHDLKEIHSLHVSGDLSEFLAGRADTDSASHHPDINAYQLHDGDRVIFGKSILGHSPLILSVSISEGEHHNKIGPSLSELFSDADVDARKDETAISRGSSPEQPADIAGVDSELASPARTNGNGKGSEDEHDETHDEDDDQDAVPKVRHIEVDIEMESDDELIGHKSTTRSASVSSDLPALKLAEEEEASFSYQEEVISDSEEATHMDIYRSTSVSLGRPELVNLEEEDDEAMLPLSPPRTRLGQPQSGNLEEEDDEAISVFNQLQARQATDDVPDPASERDGYSPRSSLIFSPESANPSSDDHVSSLHLNTSPSLADDAKWLRSQVSLATQLEDLVSDAEEEEATLKRAATEVSSSIDDCTFFSASSRAVKAGESAPGGADSPPSESPSLERLTQQAEEHELGSMSPLPPSPVTTRCTVKNIETKTIEDFEPRAPLDVNESSLPASARASSPVEEKSQATALSEESPSSVGAAVALVQSEVIAMRNAFLDSTTVKPSIETTPNDLLPESSPSRIGRFTYKPNPTRGTGLSSSLRPSASQPARPLRKMFRPSFAPSQGGASAPQYSLTSPSKFKEAETQTEKRMSSEQAVQAEHKLEQLEGSLETPEEVKAEVRLCLTIGATLQVLIRFLLIQRFDLDS